MNTPPGRLNLGRRVAKPRFQSNGYSAQRRARQSDARRGGRDRAHLFERDRFVRGRLLPCFVLLLGGRGDRGNVGLQNGSVQGGEIFRLDLVPRTQLQVQPFVQLFENRRRTASRRGVSALDGSLQVRELIGDLNWKIQRVLAAGGFRLDNFLLDRVHFLDEGVGRFKHGFCAGVGGKALLQRIKLGADAAYLVDGFIAGAHAFADLHGKFFLLLEVGLGNRKTRILGDLHLGRFCLSAHGQFDFVCARNYERARGTASPADCAGNGSGRLIMQVPNKVVQAGFSWELRRLSAEAELFFDR